MLSNTIPTTVQFSTLLTVPYIKTDTILGVGLTRNVTLEVVVKTDRSKKMTSTTSAGNGSFQVRRMASKEIRTVMFTATLAHLVLNSFTTMLTLGVVGLKAVVTHVRGLVEASEGIASVIMVDVHNNDRFLLWVVG